EGTLAELKARQRSRESVIGAHGDPEELAAALREVPGVKQVRAKSERDERGTVELTLEIAGDAEPDRTVERAVAALGAAGSGVRSVGPVRASLEAVFAELTQRDSERKDGA